MKGKTKRTTRKKPSAKPKGLSARHEAFCRYYMSFRNGTKAAERAGYSKRAARQQSSRLLTNAAIQNRLAELRAEEAERYRVEREDVIRTLYRTAFGDIRSVVSWDETGRPTVVPSDDLDDDAAAIVAGITFDTETRKDKDGRVTRTDRVTLKIVDRLRAVKMLGDHLQMFTIDGATPPVPPALPPSIVLVEKDMRRKEGAGE